MTVNLRNAVLLALMQTGLLVVGILGVAASNALARKLGQADLQEQLFFIRHGWLLMPLPLVWIGITAWLMQKRSVKESWKFSSFMSGIALLVLLTCGMLVEARQPWRATGMMSLQTPTD